MPITVYKGGVSLVPVIKLNNARSNAMSISKNKEILSKHEPGYNALYQSQEVIKTKRDFHELLDRNGFHVIPYKSVGNTVEYLKHVRA